MAKVNPLPVGSIAPDFTLPNQNDTPIRLRDLLDQQTATVLFFYPKDNSAGCTAEACSFRDSYEVFKEAGAEVVGISDDSVTSHEDFISKHRLPYIILSDKGGKVREMYGLPTSLGFIRSRVTFVLDQSGTVRHVFNSQLRTNDHVTEALRIINQLQAQPSTTN